MFCFLIEIYLLFSYLENCNSCPEKGIKVFPVTNSSFWVAKFAAEQVHAKNAKIQCYVFDNIYHMLVPEYEYEKC